LIADIQLLSEKEVKIMKFKIIHIWIVDAKNKTEMRQIFSAAIANGTTDNFFETEIIKPVEELQGTKAHLKSQFGWFK
jgi:hypothetical protein